MNFDMTGMGGLLSDEEQANARQMALLQAGLGIMAAGGQTGLNRVPTGAAIGMGAMQGLNAYQQAIMSGVGKQRMLLQMQAARREQEQYQRTIAEQEQFRKTLTAGGANPWGLTEDEIRLVASMPADEGMRLVTEVAKKRLTPEKNYRLLTHEEKVAQGLDPRQAYKTETTTGDIVGVGDAGGGGPYGNSLEGSIMNNWLAQYGDTPENRAAIEDWYVRSRPQMATATGPNGEMYVVPVQRPDIPRPGGRPPVSSAGSTAAPRPSGQAPAGSSPPARPSYTPTPQSSIPPGAIPIGQRPLSEGERISSGFAKRMINAEQIMADVGDAGYPTYGTNIAGGVPIVGSALENRIMTPQQQQYRQAQEDWVRAKLRKESGAVIGDEEMAREIRTYFPLPDDSPQVIAQKARARQIATQGMIESAGPAYRPAPPAPSPRPSAGRPTKRYNPATGKLEDIR